MKKLIIASLLMSASAYAYEPQMSHEVAVCEATLFGQKKEITVYRDMVDKGKATILYKDLSKPVVAFQNILFTEAVATRVGNSIEVSHQKINLKIDLASEKSDKTMSGKWDNTLDLNCRIITPVID